MTAAKAGKAMSPEACARMAQTQRKRFENPVEREKNRAIAIAREMSKRRRRLQDPIETMIFGTRST